MLPFFVHFSMGFSLFFLLLVVPALHLLLVLKKLHSYHSGVRFPMTNEFRCTWHAPSLIIVCRERSCFLLLCNLLELKVRLDKVADTSQTSEYYLYKKHEKLQWLENQAAKNQKASALPQVGDDFEAQEGSLTFLRLLLWYLIDG